MGKLQALMESNNGIIICIALLFVVLVFGVIAVCCFCLYRQRKRHRQPNIHQPMMYPLPKYHPDIFLNTMERDKIYETQILEMPMSDEDLATLKQSSLHSNERLANAHYRSSHYHGMPSQQNQYDRSNVSKYHDDGDFAMEENMYAVHNPNSRFGMNR